MRKSVNSKFTIFWSLTLSFILCSCKGEMGNSSSSFGSKSPNPSSSASTVNSQPIISAVVIVGKKERVTVAKAEIPVEVYQVIAE